MRQTEQKSYPQPSAADSRRLSKIVINFNHQSREIDDRRVA